MYTYLPIAASALFSKTEWKPIKHNAVKDDDPISAMTDPSKNKASKKKKTDK